MASGGLRVEPDYIDTTFVDDRLIFAKTQEAHQSLAISSAAISEQDFNSMAYKYIGNHKQDA